MIDIEDDDCAAKDKATRRSRRQLPARYGQMITGTCRQAIRLTGQAHDATT